MLIYQGSYLQPLYWAFKSSMSEEKVAIQCIFKETKAYFTTLEFKRKVKVLADKFGHFLLPLY